MIDGGGVAIGTGIKLRKYEQIIFKQHRGIALDEAEIIIVDKIILRLEQAKTK